MPTLTLLSEQSLALHVPGQVLSPDELSAIDSARSLLAQCQAQGQALIERGRQQMQQQIDAGYQQGLDRAAAECTQRLMGYERQHHKAWAERERQVIDLVNVVLDRVAPALPKGDLVRALVQAAVTEARQTPRLLVKVHPSAVDAVAKDLDGLRRTCPWLESLEVLGVDELREDDCLLESPHGSVSAGWQTQLAAIRAMLDNSVATT
jgi:type III secretion protein L